MAERMISLDAWMPEVLPHVPGCPTPVAEDAIRSAAQTFCHQTLLWRYDEEDTLGSGDFELEFSLPASLDMVAIDQITAAGRPLEPRTTQWLDEWRRGWRQGEIEGAPEFYAQLRNATALLVPFEPVAVKYSLFVKPANSVQSLPQFLWLHYKEAIRMGALAELQVMPGKPWSNPSAAEFNRLGFESAMQRGGLDRVRGQQRARIRSTPSFF